MSGNVFKYHVILLRLSGINVTVGQISKLNTLAFLLYVCSFSTITVMCLLGIQYPTNTFQRCIQILLFVSSVNNLIKITVLFYYQNNLKRVFDHLGDIKVSNSNNATKISVFLSKFMFYACFLGITLWCAMPVITNVYELVVPVWPLEKMTVVNFWIGNSLEFVIGLELGYVLSISVSIILLCCSQMTSLLIDLIKKVSVLGKEASQENCDKFIEYVKQHLEILRIWKDLNFFVNILFLFQTIYSTLMSCIVAVSLTKMEFTVSNAVRMFPMILIVYSELFMYCWAGENVTTQFDLLHRRMYDNGWYRETVPFRKIMLMSQCQTGRTKIFRGAGVLRMSLRTFLFSLREALSYYMVFRSVSLRRSV